MIIRVHYYILFLSICLMSGFVSSCKSDIGEDVHQEQQEQEVIVPKQEMDAIDLGLSVKWAVSNLGTADPRESGDFFAWGETESKSEFFKNNYKFQDTRGYTKYNTLEQYGIVDNKTVLEPSDDVAHQKLGGLWRMPTVAECQELLATLDNPLYEWTFESSNTYKGCIIKYLVTGAELIIPYTSYHSAPYRDTGLLWTSCLHGELDYYGGPFDAETLLIGERSSGGFDTDVIPMGRFHGIPVRAVTD